LLMAAHAFFDVRSLPYSPDMYLDVPIFYILTLPLPLGIAFLIARLIFEEALPGDRQFWLTRPYRWPELLAAKVLFVVLFLNVGLFLSDCCILAAQGFPVISVLPQLLLRQVFMTTLFILPPFAVATLASGVSQFVLAWFILFLAPICESIFVSMWLRRNPDFINFDGGPVSAAVLVGTALGVIIWQYARRRTAAARWAVFALTCVFVPVTSGVSHLTHSREVVSRTPPLPNQSVIRLVYDPVRKIPFKADLSIPHQGSVNVRIPVTAVGLPTKTLLRGSGRMVFDLGGTAWPSPGSPLACAVRRIDNQYWLTTGLEMFSIDILRQQPVNIHATLEVEIVTDEVKTRVLLATRSLVVPDLGLCHIFHNPLQTQLMCRAGLEPSLETDVRMDSPATEGGIIATYRPHQIPWGLSPASDLGASGSFRAPSGFEYAFIPRRKITEFQLNLDLNNIRLADYTLPH
jgi:hypothetical protein